MFAFKVLHAVYTPRGKRLQQLKPKVQDWENERTARSTEVENAQLHSMKVAGKVYRTDLKPHQPRRDIDGANLRTNARTGKIDRSKFKSCNAVGHIVYDTKIH